MNCNDCDKPLATNDDANACACDGGDCAKCDALCWANFNHGCTSPIDWRGRALLAESARAALTADLHKAEARLREVKGERDEASAERDMWRDIAIKPDNKLERAQAGLEHYGAENVRITRVSVDYAIEAEKYKRERDAVIKERDEARGECQRMRPVVDAARGWLDTRAHNINGYAKEYAERVLTRAVTVAAIAAEPKERSNG